MRTLLTLGLVMTALAGRADETEEWMARGDAADAAYRAEEALRFYLQVEERRPDDAALLVKIARQYVYRMPELGTAEAKIESGKTALEYAERAVKAEPGRGEAHLAVAICVGKITQLQGSREKVEGSKRIKAAAERAVKLDPGNDYAWHLLGRWHQALAGMSGLVKGVVKLVYGALPPASNEEALRCFEKALALRPDRLIHHVEIGRTYAQMGRKEEARKALTKGLAMPNREKDDPETKQRGRAALEKL
jgi:tetratricopeptide (TPR) repeat protein